MRAGYREQSIHQYDKVRIGDGTWIGFRDCSPGEGPFFVLRITLRSRDLVSQEGSSHARIEASRQRDFSVLRESSMIAAQTTLHLPLIPQTAAPVEAVLECTYAAGLNIGLVAWQSRTLGLIVGAPLEVGRLYQPGFFEHLLQKEPRWLSYLSGRHCELTLSSSAVGWWGFRKMEYTLAVENFSNNVLQLDRQSLAQGGTLAFTALVDGRSRAFLQFKFAKVDTAQVSGKASTGIIACDCLHPTPSPTYVKIDESGI